LRVTIVALGGAALTSAALSVWWLRSPAIAIPSPPSLSEKHTAAAPPGRLAYRLDTMREHGVIAIVNQDRFSWTDVHVEIGEGFESFQCPSSSTIGIGYTLVVQGRLCRSSDGHVPMSVCVVRVAAKEGAITSGFEPCAPVQ
jgi:hypothetical protein